MADLRYRYVDTSRGQLHVTECDGAAGIPIVLMHWVPLSGHMYDRELPHFAALGYRPLALDLMGFGRSSRRDGAWQINDHAQAVAETLTALDAADAVMLGGHFSASIAIELALDPALSARAVALDGSLLMPQEAFAAIRSRAEGLKGPGLHKDGSHRTWLWDQAVQVYQVFDRDFQVTDDTVPVLYQFVQDYLATGFPKEMGTDAPYDFAAQLPKLTVPALVLSSETEPLRPSYDAMLAVTPNSTGHLFPGGHPLHNPAREGEYAGAVHDFVSAL